MKAAHKHIPLAHIVTVAGCGLSVYGSFTINCPYGLSWFIAGRVMDGLDGSIARRCGTSSEFGAHLDRQADRIAVGSLCVNVLARQILPTPLVAILLGQRVANVVILHYGHRRTGTLIPSRPEGKVGSVLQQVGLGAQILGLRYGKVITLVGLGVSLMGTRKYLHDACG